MRQGRLQFLRELGKKYETPVYLLDSQALKQRIDRLKEAFTSQCSNCNFYYPFKSNDLPYLCHLIQKQNLGAEVASRLELKLALQLGFENILFNGPGKSKKGLDLAIKHKDQVTIIADSMQELRQISNDDSKRPEVGVRLTCQSRKRTKWSKFGIKPKRLKKALDLDVNIIGLHFHIGSQMKDATIYENELKQISKLLTSLPATTKAAIKFLDIGGGLDSEGYRKYGFLQLAESLSNRDFNLGWLGQRSKQQIAITSLAEKITAAFNQDIRSISGLEDINLYLEPGRWTVNPTMHLLTSVVDKKSSGAVVDGGLNLVPHIIYEKHPIYNLSQPRTEDRKKKIYGNLCQAKDIIGRSYKGRGIAVGDLMLIKNVGAYSLSQSTQFMRPQAGVVAFDFEEGKSKLVRRGEDFAYRYKRDRLNETNK